MDVYYNNVRLKNVHTRQCDQALVYDATGTDLLGEKVSLGFECTVHSQNLASLFLHGGIVGDNPAGQAATATAQFHLLRARLSEPRKELRVVNGDDVLWHCVPGSDPDTVLNNPESDVDAGPKPKDVKIVAVMGQQAYRISFAIEFMWGACPESNSPANLVISNKWSILETRDANFFTTRTVTGQIRFSSRLWAGHGYLNWCVPGLEYGFKRESISYEADASGLEARYSVVDRQVHTAAPWPATGISGSYTWSTSFETGHWVHNSDFTLVGAPDSDVGLLVARAIELCDARVKYLEGTLDTQAKLLNEASITEHVGEGNSVRVTMTVTMYPGDGAVTMLLANIAQNQIGVPIQMKSILPYPNADPEDAVPYDVGRSRVPAPWGYVPRHAGARDPAKLFLMHCYQQDPCSPKKVIYQWGAQDGRPEDRQHLGRVDAPMVELPPGTLPTGNLEKFNEEQRKSIYTYIRLSSQYRVSKRRGELSVADDSASEGTGAVIRWGRGVARRLVHYEAERQDDWPAIPDLSESVAPAGQGKHVLLDYMVEPSTPRASPDGLHLVYHVNLWALYALPDGLPDDARIASGKLPYLVERKELDLAAKRDPSML